VGDAVSGFWTRLRERLDEPEFRAAFERESELIAETDRLVNAIPITGYVLKPSGERVPFTAHPTGKVEGGLREYAASLQVDFPADKVHLHVLPAFSYVTFTWPGETYTEAW